MQLLKKNSELSLIIKAASAVFITYLSMYAFRKPFTAAQYNNIGGNPALSNLSNKEYGYEFNISAKYFPSKKWYWHGHLAYTIPGEGAKLALNNTAKPWLSAMVFFRYSL